MTENILPSATGRLRKNTIILYIRSLIVMTVMFWVSRLVLQALGVTNYGIYSVVGGIVTTLSVLTNTLSQTISRFITVAIGCLDREEIGNYFRLSVWMSAALSLLIVFIAETAGLWFLNTQLNIPLEKMNAANIVFQFSVVTFILSLLSQPYDALLSSYEKFHIITYIFIAGSILNLIIACMLFHLPDRLIWYSGLIMANQLLQRIFYRIYCIKKFPVCTHKGSIHWKQTKKMLSFSGWSLYLTFAECLSNQGVNILLNIYFGVVVNAARGLAQQVSNAVLNLGSSFSTALAPQLMKSYSAGDKTETIKLIFNGTRYGYFLLYILLGSLFVELPFLFNIWLVDVPPHLTNFTRLSFIYLLINILTTPIWYLQMATGKVAFFSVVTGTLSLLNMPLSYGCLYYGLSPESVYFVWIALIIAITISRFILTMKNLPWFSFNDFFKKSLFQIILVSFISISGDLLFNETLKPYFKNPITHIIFFGISTAITIYLFGTKKQERLYVKIKIKNLFRKNKKASS